MNTASRWLATVGMLVAGPAFLLNLIAHDGKMPGPDDADRVDGAFSLMFMAGAGLIFAAIVVAERSPAGCNWRHLLRLEAAMITFAAVWAVFIIIDPANKDSNNPFILIGDASWPLHQALMLIVGIVAVRARQWPSAARYALFGPAAGLVTLLVAAALNIDIIAATAIGAGWVIAGLGVLAVANDADDAADGSAACPRPLANAPTAP